ncbi:MAG TPA: hypothetical protein VNO33_05670 [Kofleriaceae bacterium]|nr:hypothetical protein [Kofleriaceae bacterium]
MRPNLRECVPAFVLLLTVACGGGKKEAEKPAGGEASADDGAGVGGEQGLPSIPSKPAPLPATVLAALSVGDPQGQLASMAAYADAVQPGFGAMLAPAQLVQGAAGAVGAPGLDGVDMTKPLHLLLLDPQKGGGQALLVVGVADQQKMAGTVGGGAVMQVHGGYAAIGTGAALQAASPYALSNLAKTAPPKHPHAVIYMNRIMESYGPQLDAQLRQSMGGNPQAAEKKVAEGLVKVLSGIERIEGDLEASAQMATASFAVFPQQGSAVAEWAGLQKPSDYLVASRLPAGAWLMVAAGRVDSGPLKAFTADIAAAQGKPEIAEWVGVFGQEIAFALLAKEDKTVRMAGLVAVTDAKKLGGLVADYVKKMAAAPTQMDEMQVTAKAGAYRTGGATLHGITIKPGTQSSPEEKKDFEKVFGKGGIKSYFGVAGDWMVFSLDKDKPAKGMAAKLVQSSKAKQPKSALAPSFEKALADSKTRNESAVMVFDLSALAPDPTQAKGAEVTLGLGFEGPVMRTRLTVPPATMRFFVQQQMRGGQPPPPPPPPPAKK